MSMIEKTPRAGALWLITVITLIYLIVEFSFNSRLLDVVGGAATTGEIDSIEKFGRYISGFAVALAFWPTILKREVDTMAKLGIIAIATSLIVAAVYIAEGALVDRIVDSSSAKERYAASNLTILQRTLITGDAELDGLDLSGRQFNEPDAKAFLAVFPLVAFSVANLDKKINKREVLEKYVQRKLGSDKERYNQYVESIAGVQDMYKNKYIWLLTLYNTELSRVGRRQDEKWAKYKKGLHQKFYISNPAWIPKKYTARIRASVQAELPGIPNNWNPADKAGFYKVIRNTITANADQSFREAAFKLTGNQSASKNMSYEQFASSAAIQSNWREKLGITGITVKKGLRSDLNLSEYVRDFYLPLVKAKVDDLMAQYDAPVAQFADGGAHEELGKSAMKALLIPSIALAFSLIGAIVHAFKFSFFTIHLVTGYAFVSEWIKWPVIMLGAALTFTSFNLLLTSNVTQKPLYQYLEKQMPGTVLPFVMRSTIQGQVIAYPKFEWVRKNVLMGASFGYSGKDLPVAAKP